MIEGPDWLTWENAKAVAESNFLSALFASMAGAFFGAIAAYKLAERGRERDTLQAELMSVNAAIHRCHGVFNTFVNLKSQHAKSLKETFDAAKLAVVAHKAGLENGTIPAGTALPVDLDFRSLSRLKIDISELQAAVLDKTQVAGRPRTMIQAIASSIGTVDDLIAARNELLQKHQAMQIPDGQRIALVFGLPLAGRRIDTSFGDYVQGIFEQTNDCLYFGKTLCDDLTNYGKRVRARLLKVAKGKVPNAASVDFSSVNAGLLPDVADYREWEQGFPSGPPNVEGGSLYRLGVYSIKQARAAWRWLWDGLFAA